MSTMNTITIHSSDCQIGKLQVHASHHWTVPDFGVWITEKQITLLGGPVFSPFQGIQLQVKIILSSQTEARVFLKNCTEIPVSLSSASMKFVGWDFNYQMFRSSHTEEKESFTLAVSTEWPLPWPMNKYWERDIDPLNKQGVNTLKITCNLVVDVSPTQMIKSVKSSVKTGISHSLAKQLQEPRYTDWTLICEEEEISCHRVLLASQSPVFDRMFQGSGFSEGKTSKTVIKDISLKTLKALVRFLYTETLDPVNDDLQALFATGDKYMINELSSACETHLVRMLTAANALELFLLADLHRGQVLREKAKKLIAANFKTIKTSEKWIELRSEPNFYPIILEITDLVE